MSTRRHGQRLRGRGAVSNPPGRFDRLTRADFDDGWYAEEAPASIATTVTPERAQSIVTQSGSPDIPFGCSGTPPRGGEHGCIYCCARPSRSYGGLSPGLDFETRLFYKADAPRVLRETLARRGYRC